MDDSLAARVLVLEALTLATCPAEHEIKLGEWVLRSSQSSVMRANTITVFGDDLATPAMREERLKIAETWYAQQGKKIQFRISTHPAAMAVDRALQARGYIAHDSSLVMQISDLSSADLGLKSTSTPTQWKPIPIDVGAATQWRMLSRGEAPNVAAREADAARTYGAGNAANAVQTWLDSVIAASSLQAGKHPIALRRNTFACAIYDGAPSANNLIASGVARTCGAHIGLFNIYTVFSHRGQGCAEAITQALLNWGRAQQALHAFLQVEADNVAAIRLYARLSFGEVYRYHYLRSV